MLKRVLSLCFAVVCIFTMLTACVGKKEEEKTTGEKVGDAVGSVWDDVFGK